ncbi:hypothetical protein AWB71_02878 [Caballeronia peredens]|nr:hypothetical protein AWB71_02878 [Caballeronia peredens]
MNNILMDIPPPSYWQEFERLTLDVCRIRWKDDYAERHGRDGQSQSGVDVYGHNHASSCELSGVQCKKRKNKSKGLEVPAHSLSTEEIDEEISAASSFQPHLRRFIIATTGERDEKMQGHVRLLNAANKHPFQVALWFWDDYVDFLNCNENVMYKYFSSVLRYRKTYSEDEHYLRMLALAFDRPAIRTTFRLENRATDFIAAISGLQQAVKTGTLKDRDGHTIDEARRPSKLGPELKAIGRLLTDVRNLATDGLVRGAIVDHGTVIEIREESLQHRLNALRRDVVDTLNILLHHANIEPVEVENF